MGRKSKYSKKFKIHCVQEYLSGKTFKLVSRENHLPKYGDSNVRKWVREFCEWGPECFDTKPTNNRYTPEFKLKVVREYLQDGVSQRDLSIKYGIRSKGTISRWVRSYNAGLTEGESSMKASNQNAKNNQERKKARKFTLEEKNQAVNFCIENNRDYQKTVDAYGCSYQQIYQWIRKVDEGGLGALEDRRGKRKNEEELSSEEKQTRYVKQLEADNERLQREVALLKKLKALERKW